MKKLMILQIKSNELGGVWFFNKTISEELLKYNFQIEIVAIRDNHSKNKLEIAKSISLKTINEQDKWEITRKKDILKALKTLKFKNILMICKKYLSEHKKLKEDFTTLKNYIKKQNPDYIIASHYQTLDGIPKEYLKKTIAIQHSSLKDVLTLHDNTKKLKKYSKKIFKMVWLSKKTSELAEEKGFSNNTYMYNPVRFQTKLTADVIKNKKLISVTRIDNSQKRIDLMLDIANTVLKDSDWTFELYGTGEFTDYAKKILNNNKKIKYMGKTDNPMQVLLNASINLNTSRMEGFSLSILEANMCGVPTVTFDFGESAPEEIINDKTGYIIYNDSKEEYIEKLLFLMNNSQKLQKLANNSKKFGQKFTIDKIIQNWLKLFGDLDNYNRKG